MSNIMKCWCWCWIYDSKQKHPALHTSERTIVPRTVIFNRFWRWQSCRPRAISILLNDLNNGQCLPCIAGATWIQRRCQAEFARSNQIPNCTNRTTLARVMKTQERLVTGQWSAQYLSRFKRLSPRGQLGINLVTYLGWGCPLWQQPVSRLDNLKLCFWAQTGHCISCKGTKSLCSHSFTLTARSENPKDWSSPKAVCNVSWRISNILRLEQCVKLGSHVAILGMHGWQHQCQNLSVLWLDDGRLYRLFSNWTEAHFMAFCKWSSPMVEILIWIAATVTLHGCTA